MQHYIGDRDKIRALADNCLLERDGDEEGDKEATGTGIKKGTLFIFISWSCTIENINEKKKIISNALHFVCVKRGSFRA